MFLWFFHPYSQPIVYKWVTDANGNGHTINNTSMAFDLSKSPEIIQMMEKYIDSIRPEPEIRPKLDMSYELTDHSLFLL